MPSFLQYQFSTPQLVAACSAASSRLVQPRLVLTKIDLYKKADKMLEIGDIMQVYGRLSELLALASSMEDPSAELQGALSRAGVDIAVAVSRVSTAVSAALPPTPPPPPPPASFAPPPPPPHLPLLPAQPADSWKVTLRVPDEQKLEYTWRNQELWAEAQTKPMDIAMVGDAFIDALIVCQGYQMGYSNGVSNPFM